MESKQPSSLKDFEVTTRLGEGAFGQVFKVKRKADGQIYALKKVKIGSMKQKERDNALNEIRILASYQGENIIGYKQAFYEDESRTLCIVMEFAAGGDVLKSVQKHIKARTNFPEEEIWRAMVHMTQGLKELHDRKILHRDMKCANIFVTADNVYKLGDLNVSKVLKKEMAYTQTGTPYYASPEVWKDRPYGVKSDMWSLGCVLYEMASLKPPFTAHDLQGLYRKICAGQFQRIPMKYSNQLENMIRSLLKQNPNDRPNCDQLLENPIVHKNYKGTLQCSSRKENNDQLLKTIIYDPRNLPALKKKLPKPKYEENSEQKTKRDEERKKDEESQEKLRKFIEKRKEIEEKERINQLKNLEQEKVELEKKRERVLSACGVRKASMCDSPKKNIPPTPVLGGNKAPGNMLPKLPPKPNGQNTPNYKMPPRPLNSSRGGSNRSIDNSREKRVDRSMSKQNLKRAGEQIVGGCQPPQQPAQRIQRSSSAQKIVYPSWWS